jgi:glucose-1-phosphate adenylyltransferase
MEPHERGYWRDVGAIDTYYEANMDLISVTPQLNLYNYQWPILTNQGNLPPAKTVFDSEGRRGHNWIHNLRRCGRWQLGAFIRASCRVNSYALVEDSILFDNVDIGRNAKIRKAIIDENIVIPEGMEIGFDHEEDRERGCIITEAGVVVVTK